MLDQDALIQQVLYNCDVADAHHAGLHSVCGLALRLRELYKWEKGLDPWVEKESSTVLDWIGQKEERWEDLSDKRLRNIDISGVSYDPFDSHRINTVLEPFGLFYGSGYAWSLRPTFFLALLETKKKINGHTVYIQGRELARDLFTTPALAQDDCVLIRQQTACYHLWDQILYVRKSSRPALQYALQNYGIDLGNRMALRKNLARIVADQIESYIYHELSEIEDQIFDRAMWREIIAAFPRSPIEFLARTVKDLLADTNPHGRLSYIVRERKAAPLGFYVAFMENLTKTLFPEIFEAFQDFSQSGNWQIIERAAASGYDTARRYAETMVHIYRKGKQHNDLPGVKEEIARSLLET